FCWRQFFGCDRFFSGGIFAKDNHWGASGGEAAMFVREAMTERPLWIAPNITLIEAARKMRDESIGCLPVGENDRLIGMITDRDLACRAVAEGGDPAQTKVRDVMTRGIAYCLESDDLAATIEQMEKKRV